MSLSCRVKCMRVLVYQSATGQRYTKYFRVIYKSDVKVLRLV